MALEFQLLVVTLAMLVAAEAKELISIDPQYWLPAPSNFDVIELGDRTMCDGLVRDCYGDEEEMMMESEASRRMLDHRRRRFVSYRALKKDLVPCNRRGHSYYNCRSSSKANPYRRGCNVITQCKRFTN